MLSSSNIGLELPRDIDPCVNWKTAPKGRRRAVRRARNSVTGDSNRQKAATTSSNGSEIASDEEFKEADQVLASESEKVCFCYPLGISCHILRLPLAISNVEQAYLTVESFLCSICS